MTVASIQLENLGVLPRIGLKGPQTADWLRDKSVDLPARIFDTIRLTDGTLIVKLGTPEFMLESSSNGVIFSQVENLLSRLPDGVYQIPRGEVTLVMGGNDAHLVFAQTCGIDVRKAEMQRVFYTRVAGVSCGILPEQANEPEFRIWVDYGFAPYLWETLAGVATELGGKVVDSERAAAPRVLAAH